MKFKLYIYFFTTIIFLYIPNALAGITQSKPNIYICDLSNALLLIQFNDISGHLVGDYRGATLPTGGTSEQITDQPFSGFEHDGAISITFQDGTNWIGKVNGQHLDFMIPHFIIGEPLSTVVFKSSTAKAYDRQQTRMVDTINHNVMINRERANVLATMKKSKHTADQISYDYKKLSRLESIKILTPETVIEKYKSKYF